MNNIYNNIIYTQKNPGKSLTPGRNPSRSDYSIRMVVGDPSNNPLLG